MKLSKCAVQVDRVLHTNLGRSSGTRGRICFLMGLTMGRQPWTSEHLSARRGARSIHVLPVFTGPGRGAGGAPGCTVLVDRRARVGMRGVLLWEAGSASSGKTFTHAAGN